MLKLLDDFYRLPTLLRAFLLTLLVSGLAVWGGRYIGTAGMPAFRNFVQLGIVLAGGLLVFFNPFVGLITITALLPLSNLITGLPFGSNLFLLLGGATVAGQLAHQRWGENSSHLPTLRLPHLLAVLFIAWLFVSNPAAALLGGDRTWLLTFIQLGFLMGLTTLLVRTPQQQRWVLLAFALAAAISAVYAIQDSPLFQEGAALRRERTGGLTGINAAARYFLVALPALNYLRLYTTRPVLRLLALAGMGVLVIGILATGSRTGYLLLPFTGVLLLINPRSGSGFRQVLVLVLLFGGLLLVIPDGVWRILDQTLALSDGGSSGETRYYLWQAGLAMWQEHPLAGVGIGQYPVQLPLYGRGLLPPNRLEAGAHSIYVGLLAETGLIGLLLFLALAGSALYVLFRATRWPDEQAPLAFTWLAMLLVMLLGGLTKHDQYDKLIWFLFGISTLYAGRTALPSTPETSDAAT